MKGGISSKRKRKRKTNTDLQKLLEDAIAKNDPDAVRNAIASGADPNARGSDNICPLCMACKQPDMGAATALLDAGGDIDATDNDGRTALWHMANEGNTAACRFLIEAGADRGKWDDDNQPPFEIACWEGHADVIQLFLLYDPDIIGKNKGYPHIHMACGGKDMDTVRLLLGYGADVNDVDENNDTPLHVVMVEWANRPVLPELVRLLLERGADPDSRNRSGYSPADILLDPHNKAPQKQEIITVFKEYAPGALFRSAVSLKEGVAREEIIDWYREHHPEMVMEKFCTQGPG